MPRGFLVKRYSKTSSLIPCLFPPTAVSPSSVTDYQLVDEDKSESSSDHDFTDPKTVEGNHSHSRRPADPLCSVNSPSSPNLEHCDSNSCQDVPLALTADKSNTPTTKARICNQLYHPIRNSILYFPRHEDIYTPSTPPPLRPKPSSIYPNSAPASFTTSLQRLHSNQKADSCYTPKKRNTDTNPETKSKATKKTKVVRKLNFDEDKTSPVSGTFIRDIDEDDDMLPLSHPSEVKKGDIDPSLNVVVITEEARAELAKIENKIGDYVCQLCKEHYNDAFGLAQHRCSRIIHVEYRCPECDKVFNCPANLASHRRWHKPRPVAKALHCPPKLLPTGVSKTKEHAENAPIPKTPQIPTSDQTSEEDFKCHLCFKKFAQHFHYRKHLLSHLTSNANEQEENEVIKNVFTKERRGALLRLNVTPEQSDNTVGDFRCTICCMKFENKTDMEKHTFTHNELKGIQCSFCPSIFYTSAGLTRHINNHHSNENRQLLLLQAPTVGPLST